MKIGTAPFVSYRDSAAALRDELDELVSTIVSDSLEDVVLPVLDTRSATLWGTDVESSYWTDEDGELHVGWQDDFAEEAQRREIGDDVSRPAPVLRIGLRSVEKELSDELTDRLGRSLR